MKLTVFSFLMSMIWSSIIILLVHLFRKKQFFLNGFGLTTVFLLYLFSIGRMFLAIEFPFTHEIPVPEVYNTFFKTIGDDWFAMGEIGISLIDTFLLLWCITSAVLITIFLIRYHLARSSMRTYRFIPSTRLESILAEIQKQFSCRLKIQIAQCSEINLPMGFGIFKKQILIPSTEYSDDELRYIILHEYMHFRNKDLQILLLSEIFARLFWWNPFVYLLKSDIRQILEIKCDLSVITGMTDAQRVNYLKAIQTCLIQSNKLKARYAPIVSTQLIRKDNKKEEMLERFRLIAYPIKKNYVRFQILSIVGFMLLLVISYSFILQPQYQPPEEDVFTHSDVETTGTLTGHILARQDGTYIFVDETGFEMEIGKETVDVFAATGIEIIEE